MPTLRSTFSSALFVLALLPGCKGDSAADDGETGDGTGGDTLYDRLGGETGVTAVVEDAVLDRIAADPRINGYFLNSGTDIQIVINCLVDQLGSLTGGPQTYPNDNCRDMVSSHEGLGISDADFNDLAGHFVAEFEEVGVAQADIDILVGALTGMYDDIVEDPTNDGSVYQRVGRQPAIASVVTAFVDLVLADPTLMAFFASTDRVRLEGCLTRQICSIGGPCAYGMEVTALPEFAAGACRDMLESHMSLTITQEDFDALVGHLVEAMTTAEIVQADQDIILGVLGPMCADIVTDPSSCP